MTDMPQLLAAAAERTTGIVEGIDDADLGRPTPCEAYDVRALLNHLIGVYRMFDALGHHRQPPEDALTGDHMDGDWRTRYRTETGRVLAAWTRPSAYEGMSPLGLPAAMAPRLLLTDLVVHGWDLAIATGQNIDVDETVAENVHDMVRTMGDRGRARGVFAAPVPVPADAPLLDRILGDSGRDPRWRAARH